MMARMRYDNRNCQSLFGYVAAAFSAPPSGASDGRDGRSAHVASRARASGKPSSRTRTLMADSIGQLTEDVPQQLASSPNGIDDGDSL
jgi:hypothetical protein